MLMMRARTYRKKTMSLLPEATYVNMKNSWLEFERASPEARYARVIDALVPLINHLKCQKSIIIPIISVQRWY